MGSEADLDADIKALSILSEHPNLYDEFAQLGCISSLVSLLSHENTDIAIDAIEIISELTDEDVEAEEAQWDVLVDALVSSYPYSQVSEILMYHSLRPTSSTSYIKIYLVLMKASSLTEMVSTSSLVKPSARPINHRLTRFRGPREPLLTSFSRRTHRQKPVNYPLAYLSRQKERESRQSKQTICRRSPCHPSSNVGRKSHPFRGT